jgi:hypothetical protein
MRNIDIIKDYSGEALVIKTSQDCSSIIEENKRLQNESQEDLSFGRRFASIPIDVLDAWIKEGVDYRKIAKDPSMAKKFKAKINSPEFRYFKTHTGQV